MEVKDGTAEFLVRDQRIKAMIDFFFPVGAIYTCVTKPPWMEEYGEWQEVGAGRVLWGEDDVHKAGTEIEAGLPNITGDNGNTPWSIVSEDPVNFHGCITYNPEKRGSLRFGESVTPGNYTSRFEIDASKSNPIYGSSDTVQPPAYVVHFYQRIS